MDKKRLIQIAILKKKLRERKETNDLAFKALTEAENELKEALDYIYKGKIINVKQKDSPVKYGLKVNCSEVNLNGIFLLAPYRTNATGLTYYDLHECTLVEQGK